MQGRNENLSIDAYLQAADDGQGGTTLYISTAGQLTGSNNGDVADQIIYLKGQEYDANLIPQMLSDNKIVIDS